MNTQSQSLLAILAALQNSSETLTDEQENAMYKLGQQLGARPEKWSSHINRFLAVFPENSEFVIHYQQALQTSRKLSLLEIFDVLPSEEDMQKTFPDIPVVKRAYFEGKTDQKSQEICNFVSTILKTSQPSQTIKKLQISQCIAQLLKLSDQS